LEYNEPSGIKVGENNPLRNGNTLKGLSYTLKASTARYVLVTPKSTSTPSKHINITSKDTKIMETAQLLTSENSQTSTYLSGDFLAKLSALLEKEKDLTTPEAHYSLTSLGLSSTKDPDIWCSKTSKVYLVTTLAKLSRQYLGFSPTWGMELNGRYLTAKDGFHKIGSESSLSDILEENVDEKYYLSQERIDKMHLRVEMNKKAGRGFQPSIVDMENDGQLKPMF